MVVGPESVTAENGAQRADLQVDGLGAGPLREPMALVGGDVVGADVVQQEAPELWQQMGEIRLLDQVYHPVRYHLLSFARRKGHGVYPRT